MNDSRYPHMQAYDSIRDMLQDYLPDAVTLPDQYCAQIVLVLSAATNIDPAVFCFNMADAFLRKYDMAVPTEVMRRVCAVCGNHDYNMFPIGNNNFICAGCADAL